MEQDEVRDKSSKEIEELKKEQDRLVIEKAQHWDRRVQLENVISKVCQWVPEAVANEDAEAKVQQLGIIIVQLEHKKNTLNALVHLDTPPEQVAERKSAIEDVAT